MRNHTAIRQWLFPAFLAGALALAPQAARAIDLGGIAKKAAGAGADSAKEAALKKVNAKLLAEGRKNQCSFKVDSDQLEAGCDKKLKNLANTLVDAKKQLQTAGVSGYKFEVSGHTDSSGKPEHNKELSGKRAAAISKEMVERGISPSEIISVGMGSEKPVVSPDKTEAQKKKNRRYEIQVRM